MRIVEFEGDRYFLLKRSASSSLVYDPEASARRYVPNDELRVVEASQSGRSAASLEDSRTFEEPLRSIADEATLALLVELEIEGPTPAVELLARTELCESDLHGILGELRAAQLVVETDLPGGRGYRTTTRASDALHRSG